MKKLLFGLIFLAVFAGGGLVFSRTLAIDSANQFISPVQDKLMYDNTKLLFFNLLPNLQRKSVAWRVTYRDPNLFTIVDPAFYFNLKGELICTEPKELIQFINKYKE